MCVSFMHRSCVRHSVCFVVFVSVCVLCGRVLRVDEFVCLSDFVLFWLCVRIFAFVLFVCLRVFLCLCVCACLCFCAFVSMGFSV